MSIAVEVMQCRPSIPCRLQRRIAKQGRSAGSVSSYRAWAAITAPNSCRTRSNGCRASRRSAPTLPITGSRCGLAVVALSHRGLVVTRRRPPARDDVRLPAAMAHADHARDVPGSADRLRSTRPCASKRTRLQVSLATLSGSPSFRRTYQSARRRVWSASAGAVASPRASATYNACGTAWTPLSSSRRDT